MSFNFQFAVLSELVLRVCRPVASQTWTVAHPVAQLTRLQVSCSGLDSRLHSSEVSPGVCTELSRLLS